MMHILFSLFITNVKGICDQIGQVRLNAVEITTGQLKWQILFKFVNLNFVTLTLTCGM